MISQRTTHYLLWFFLLSVVMGLAYLTGKTTLGGVPPSELIWLCVVGLLGLIAGTANLARYVARPFDLACGLLFIMAGLLGIVHNFGIDIVGSLDFSHVGDNSTILGLGLSLPLTLLHIFLGLTSLNQGLRSASTTRVIANSATTETR